MWTCSINSIDEECAKLYHFRSINDSRYVDTCLKTAMLKYLRVIRVLVSIVIT